MKESTALAADHAGHHESKAFDAPWVRVRGRIDKQGGVTWSPALRTAKGPVGLGQMKDGGKGDDKAKAAGPGAKAYWVSCEDHEGKPLDWTEVWPDWHLKGERTGGFTARLPYHAATRKLVFGQGKKVWGEMAVPATAPELVLLSPLDADDIDTAGIMHLRWKPGHGAEAHPQTYHVRFTPDGKEYYRVGVNLSDTKFDLDLRELPGGEHCYAEVIATNGYQTVSVTTPVFAMPSRPPQLMLGPVQGPKLFAQGFSLETGPIMGDNIEWLVDGKVVVRGGSFDARKHAKGQYVVTVRVKAPDGAMAAQELGIYGAVTGQLVRDGRPL